MPLTDFQRELLATLGARSDRYLAGGAALHHSAESLRYSDDLDFFHDAEARVAAAFAADRAVLETAKYRVTVDFSQPGFIRALVERGDAATRVDWAHDTAWRFFPLTLESWGGWVLHPVDLALNKLLALVGRDEPRDVLDLLWCDAHVLGAEALIWAVPGKDPALSPIGVIELLQRRGRVRPEEIARLALRTPVTVEQVRTDWHAMLTRADTFVRARPADEVGLLYVDRAGVARVPTVGIALEDQGLTPHRGAPGGVIARVVG